jgi:hemolysin activation/secretion protein
LKVLHALPQQHSYFQLASGGLGSRFRLRENFNGAFDVGIPFVAQGQTKTHEMRFTFRVWADL